MSDHSLANAFARYYEREREQFQWALEWFGKYPVILDMIKKFSEEVVIEGYTKEFIFRRICIKAYDVFCIDMDKIDINWFMRNFSFEFKEKCVPFIRKVIDEYQSLCDHKYHVNFGNNNSCTKCYHRRKNDTESDPINL